MLLRLGEIGLKGLEERIVGEQVMDPARYLNELNLAKGAAFGLSHNFMQVGYLRPHNRHARYRNLYFVGASTHPGTGLPIVLISARLVVARILSEQATGKRGPAAYRQDGHRRWQVERTDARYLLGEDTPILGLCAARSRRSAGTATEELQTNRSPLSAATHRLPALRARDQEP